MSRGGPTYDHERVSINIARLKKGGETFEIVIDPDLAVKYKEQEEVEIADILHAEHIYADAKKGELASELHTESIFGTQDPIQIAQEILKNGEIQLTHEHRERIQEQKYNRIVQLIHMNAINPTTKTVHPEERIRRAMDEARIKADPYKTAQQQLDSVIDKLRPILPLRFTKLKVTIHLPAEHAAKAYGTVQQAGKMLEEEWLNDGSLACSVEITAGKYNDLVDSLSQITHGNVEIQKQEIN